MRLGKLLLRSLKKKRRKNQRPQTRIRALVPRQKPAVEIVKSTTILQQQNILYLSNLIRPNEKLKESLEGFLLDQRSEHTRKAYGKDLRRFIKFLHVQLFDKGDEPITRTVIINYKESLLGEGLEQTTVDRHLATLRSFFAWMVDDGVIQTNPAEGVRFLNPRRFSRTRGFTDEQVCKILALPDIHTRTGALHYAVLMVLFYCGLRRSELCELKTTNISIERKHHILRLIGKGNSERIVVLQPQVVSALNHYCRITRKTPAKQEYLFTPFKNNRTSVFDKPIDASMVFYIVRKYANLAGITEKVSPHSCRATAISNARDHHVPDRAIQEFAGWTSPIMITRYDKRRSAVDKSAGHAINYGAGDRVSSHIT